MKITDNITSVLKYDECRDCKLCKPFLKKSTIFGGGDLDPDVTLYELHCSHEEACGQFCREDPDNSQE